MDEHVDEAGREPEDQADGYANDEAPDTTGGPADAADPDGSNEEPMSGEENGAEGADEQEKPWSGWGSFSEIQDAVSGLVDSALKTVAPATGRFPRYDLIEVPEDGYVILFDLPGLEKSDVDVSARAGEVAVEGTRSRPTMPEGANIERSERTYGRFRRAVSVPADVDVSNISAKMENGVLEIRLPRQTSQDSQHIKVD
ncbi:MAG: Hsp20/alpha crystallin family protein [Gemmatimonadota bacterium]|nr:Hsp20/alpha crystallin family protein [Gemmatimonadota bacterium]